MMKHILILLALILIPVTAGAEDTADAIEITHAYAYATTSVQKNGAVFMQITNHGSAADKVTAANADVAARVELHTHIMDGDMMMMREVEGYDLPPSETTALEPAGHHIMLMGLNAALKAGEHFPLALSLEHGGLLTIDIEIKNPGDVK